MVVRIVREAPEVTAAQPAWLADYGGTLAALERLRSYVGNEIVARVYEAWKQIRSDPVPFSHWRWHSVTAPGHRQDSSDWFELHGRLREHMAGGGVLVVVGRPRAGKTCLLERLKPLRIIDNARPGSERDAPIASEDVPPELFAIDETAAHDRHDVARVIAETTRVNRGFAMVFQRPESFRDGGIGAQLAMRPVLFLELVDHPASV